MIGALVLAACAGSTPEPDAAFKPPPDSFHHQALARGRLSVDTWETGADHQPPLPPHKDWVRTVYDGRVIRVQDHDTTNHINLPPVLDPTVGVFGLDDSGWIMVDLATGKQTLMWSDWAIDGVWTADGAWFVSAMGAWEAATQTRHPILIPDDASFVAFSPDSTATVEFKRSLSWEGSQIVTKRLFRVRDGTGTVVQEVDVSTGGPAWADDLGLAGFPWPLTQGVTVLWRARHLDWVRGGAGWQVTLAPDTRPWPPSDGR